MIDLREKIIDYICDESMVNILEPEVYGEREDDIVKIVIRNKDSVRSDVKDHDDMKFILEIGKDNILLTFNFGHRLSLNKADYSRELENVFKNDSRIQRWLGISRIGLLRAGKTTHSRAQDRSGELYNRLVETKENEPIDTDSRDMQIACLRELHKVLSSDKGLFKIPQAVVNKYQTKKNDLMNIEIGNVKLSVRHYSCDTYRRQSKIVVGMGENIWNTFKAIEIRVVSKDGSIKKDIMRINISNAALFGELPNNIEYRIEIVKVIDADDNDITDEVIGKKEKILEIDGIAAYSFQALRNIKYRMDYLPSDNDRKINVENLALSLAAHDESSEEYKLAKYISELLSFSAKNRVKERKTYYQERIRGQKGGDPVLEDLRQLFDREELKEFSTWVKSEPLIFNGKLAVLKVDSNYNTREETFSMSIDVTSLQSGTDIGPLDTIEITIISNENPQNKMTERLDEYGRAAFSGLKLEEFHFEVRRVDDEKVEAKETKPFEPLVNAVNTFAKENSLKVDERAVLNYGKDVRFIIYDPQTSDNKQKAFEFCTDSDKDRLNFTNLSSGESTHTALNEAIQDIQKGIPISVFNLFRRWFEGLNKAKDKGPLRTQHLEKFADAAIAYFSKNNQVTCEVQWDSDRTDVTIFVYDNNHPKDNNNAFEIMTGHGNIYFDGYREGRRFTFDPKGFIIILENIKAGNDLSRIFEDNEAVKKWLGQLKYTKPKLSPEDQQFVDDLNKILAKPNTKITITEKHKTNYDSIIKEINDVRVIIGLKEACISIDIQSVTGKKIDWGFLENFNMCLISDDTGNVLEYRGIYNGTVDFKSLGIGTYRFKLVPVQKGLAINDTSQTGL